MIKVVTIREISFSTATLGYVYLELQTNFWTTWNYMNIMAN